MFKSIRAKLMFSFTLVFLVSVGLGTVSYYFTQENNRLVEQAVNRDFNGSIQISELAILAQKIRRYEKEYFMYIGNAEKQAKYEREWGETFAKISAKLGAIIADRSGLWRVADRIKFGHWQASLNAYGSGFRNVVEQVNTGELNGTLAANAAVQEAKNKFRTLVNGTIEFANAKYADATAAAEQIHVKSDQLNVILLIALGTAAAVSLLLMITMPGSIIKPVKALSLSAATMSQGDLDKPVPTAIGISDFRELAATLERMRISQKTLLQRFSNGIS